MDIFLVLFLSFLAGAFPTAYLAGQWFCKVDIRRHGSGNVGATNAFRVLGKKIGAVVFLIDFLKGFLPVFLAPATPEALPIACGVSAILGHIFTPFLGFRGGKGVATGAGVLAALSPILFLIGLATWAASFGFTRIVAISSILAGSVVAISSFFLSSSHWQKGFYTAVFLLLVWTHRSNLIRLAQNKENKL